MPADSFNRADSTILSDATHPWIERKADPNVIRIINNRVRLDQEGTATNKAGAAYYDVQFTDKQSSRATLAAISNPIGGNRTASVVAVRLQPCSTPISSGYHGYVLVFAVGFNEIRIGKVNTAGYTQLGSAIWVPITGVSLEIRADGSTITALVDGVQKLSVVDSEFASGKPGIGKIGDFSIQNYIEIDDWDGKSLGGISSGGLCGGIGRCTDVSDADGFNRSSLVFPPQFPWTEVYDTSLDTPFELSTSPQNPAFMEGVGMLRIYASKATQGSQRGWAAWSPERSNDSFSRAKLIGWNHPNFSAIPPTSLGVRLNNAAAWNTQTGYVLQVDTTAQGNAAILHRLNGITLTPLGTKTTLNPAVGDVFELIASGSEIAVYQNTTKIISATDATYATGKAGFVQATAINWSGLGSPQQSVYQEWDEWAGGQCLTSLNTSKSWCRN